MADPVYRVVVTQSEYELEDGNTIRIDNPGTVQAMLNDMLRRRYFFVGMVPISGGVEGFVFERR